MGSYVLRRAFPVPPESVFDAVSNPAHATALFSGTEATRLVTPGPLRAGSVLRTTRTVAGRTVSGEATVEEHRRPTAFALRGGAQGMTVETHWLIVPDGTGSKVTFECRVKGSGLAALVEGAVTDALRAADADHLERLARVVGV